MRVAVFHNLPSGGAKRGLYGLVRYLQNTGNQVDVFVPSTADENYLPLKDIASALHVYPARRTTMGVVVSSARYILPLFHSPADLKWTQQRIAHAINAGPFDIVFSEQDQCTSSPFLLRYLKKPTVYYCQQPSRARDLALCLPLPPHLPFSERIWRAHVRRNIPKIDRENASYAKYILTNSYFSRENILRAYGRNSFVSYLGVDTSLFRHLGIAKEDFILSVGVCLPHKGFDFMIRSLGLVDKRRRPKIVIVSNFGNLGWEKHLARMAANADVDLEIKKLVADAEIVRLYNQAKLFVYTPILEPFGLAPLEAMACGTPVVAVKEGGVRETVIHNETGILTDRDEQAFATAVSELLSHDPLRERMGDGGVEAVRSFWTLEHAGERLTWHLNRAMSAGQLPAGTKNSQT